MKDFVKVSGLYLKSGDLIFSDAYDLEGKTLEKKWREVVEVFDTPGHSLSYGGSRIRFTDETFKNIFDSTLFEAVLPDVNREQVCTSIEEMLQIGFISRSAFWGEYNVSGSPHIVARESFVCARRHKELLARFQMARQ